MQLEGFIFHLISQTNRLLPATYRTSDHRHSFHELGLLSIGEAIWTMKGKRPARLRAGEAILMAPEQVHREQATKPTSFAWVGFHGPAEALAGIPMHKRISLGGWGNDIQSAIERLRVENTRHPPGHEERMRLLLADLLLLLKRAAAGVPVPEPAAEARDSIEAARLYLERNATEELTMEQVARYHGFSLAHFEVLFSKRFGSPPKQYQHRCKLRRIERSIRLGVRSPKLLAAEHGFCDAAYFCRWFKKQTGRTLSEYKV